MSLSYGKEKQAKHWWQVITHNTADNKTKAFVSNASEETALQRVVQIHAQHYWIERCFQDGKTSVGMADYQARKWASWHHHMTLVSLAMLFMLRERLHHNDEDKLLSCQDIVELLNFYLPRRDVTEEEVLANIERRHQKRLASIESAYRRQRMRPNRAPSTIAKE